MPSRSLTYLSLNDGEVGVQALADERVVPAGQFGLLGDLYGATAVG